MDISQATSDLSRNSLLFSSPFSFLYLISSPPIYFYEVLLYLLRKFI